MEKLDNITTRDYFAAQALVAIMSNPSIALRFSTHDGMSAEAYKIADAMLRAKETLLKGNF